MKKKILALGLSATLCLTLFTGCGSEKKDKSAKSEVTPTLAVEEKDEEDVEEKDTDSEDEEEETTADTSAYTDVLDQAYAVLANGYYPESESTGFNGFSGLRETYLSQGDASTSVVGYTVVDVTGDDVAELIIASIDDTTTNEGTVIFSVFTLEDSTPTIILEGWYRNMYTLLDDGTILNMGSGGADLSIVANFEFSGNDSIACLDCYFTGSNPDNSEELNCYHATDMLLDEETAEKITAEDYAAACTALQEKVVSIKLTPFSEYTPVTEYEGYSSATNEVVYFYIHKGEDVENDWSDYEEVSYGDSANAMKIGIQAVQSVTDFALNKLTYDEDGNPKVSEEIYTADNFGEELSLIMATLEMNGDLPEYGISFVDAEGVAHEYTLNVSGEDGSLNLIPFETE